MPDMERHRKDTTRRGVANCERPRAGAAGAQGVDLSPAPSGKLHPSHMAAEPTARRPIAWSGELGEEGVDRVGGELAGVVPAHVGEPGAALLPQR